MTRFAAVLIVLGTTACGGGAPKSSTGPGVPGGGAVADPIPATKGPDCAVVSDKLATVAHADTPDKQPEARDNFRKRCTDDKWSDEARNCFATVETDDEVHGCFKLLTDAQRDSMHLANPEMAPKGPQGTTSTPPKATEQPKGGTRGGTRGGTQRNSSDPCEGGEAKSDPCEGGERK